MIQLSKAVRRDGADAEGDPFLAAAHRFPIQLHDLAMPTK